MSSITEKVKGAVHNVKEKITHKVSQSLILRPIWSA